MSFKEYFENSLGKVDEEVSIIFSEDHGYELIKHENFEVIPFSFETEEDAKSYIEERQMKLVDLDDEYKELSALTVDELEMLEDDFDVVVEDNGEELEYDDGVISERLVRKKVIRKGRRIIKIKTNRHGYRVVKDGNRVKEIRMSSTEKRKRKRAQKIAGRKRKAKSKTIQRKRKISLRKRKGFS